MHRLRRAYRLLFFAEGQFAERVDAVAREFAGDPIVGKIIAFIREGGSRPLMKARARARGCIGGRHGLMDRPVLDPSLDLANADGPLAIICGGGSLPFAVADAVQRRGRKVVLFAVRGWADPQRVAAYPHHWAALGSFGRFCRLARAEGCRDVVFIGVVLRPTLTQMRVDFGTLQAVCRTIIAAFRGGDDHLLSGLARIFERDGFRLRRSARGRARDPGRRRGRSAAMPRRRATRAISHAGSRCSMRRVRSTSARLSWWPTTMCSRSRRPKAPTRCWSASPSCAGRHGTAFGGAGRAGQGAKAAARTVASIFRPIGPQTVSGRPKPVLRAWP